MFLNRYYDNSSLDYTSRLSWVQTTCVTYADKTIGVPHVILKIYKVYPYI